jgi:hypothetical protein
MRYQVAEPPLERFHSYCNPRLFACRHQEHRAANVRERPPASDLKLAGFCKLVGFRLGDRIVRVEPRAAALCRSRLCAALRPGPECGLGAAVYAYSETALELRRNRFLSAVIAGRFVGFARTFAARRLSGSGPLTFLTTGDDGRRLSSDIGADILPRSASRKPESGPDSEGGHLLQVQVRCLR